MTGVAGVAFLRIAVRMRGLQWNRREINAVCGLLSPGVQTVRLRSTKRRIALERLRMKHVIALILALVLNASANLMMKVGANRLGDAGLTLQRGLVNLVTRNWVLLLGLACFATNALFYTYALTGKHMKISLAYPIMVGGGYAIIALVAWYYLGERLSAGQWLGVAMILVGVILVARKMEPVEEPLPQSSVARILPSDSQTGG
jgi:small multidrug resistance pump